MKNIIQTIIKDFHKRGLEKFKLRNIDVPIYSGKIITLIGSRRAGKTYLQMQLMSQILKEKNISLENIVYINFEDERLDFRTQDLNLIIEGYLELFPNNNLNEVYFFFDEIQEIDGWEKFVRRVYDTISKNIYITGSSAKLLSREIATSLRGRTLTYEVFPLSFREYLTFKQIDIKDVHSTINKSKIKNEFKFYLDKGGFPEIINFNENLTIKTLQNYLDVMIFRDLVERFKITNVEVLKLFIKKAISNVSKEFSINKVFNEFKSLNLKLSKDKLYQYLDNLEEIYLLFFISQYSESIQKQELSLKKVYSIDTGLNLANSFKFSENKGRLLENLVFIELKRRSYEIYYHKQKKECDFVIKEGLDIVQAIQVTKSLEDIDTKKREIAGLLDACSTYRLKTGLILTEDEEYELEQDGVKIQVIPIWKWLLPESQ